MKAQSKLAGLLHFPAGRSASSRYSPLAEVRRHWAVFLGLGLALAIWGGLDVARRAIVDPAHPARHMTDFTVYTEAGAAFFDGRQPYEVANIRGWKYLYPPLFAMLVAPLYHVAPPVQASVWFVLSALMVFGCYIECRRLIEFLSRNDAPSPRGGAAGRVADPPQIAAGSVTRSTDEIGRLVFSRSLIVPRWLLVTALVAVAFPALNCLQRGQMGVALLYGLLVGFRLVISGRTTVAWLAGGLALALPIAFKLTPALPALAAIACLFVAGVSSVIERRGPHCSSSRLPERVGATLSQCGWSSAGLIVGCLLFFLVIPGALVGWNANLGHLQTWYAKVGRRVDDVRADDFGENVATVRNQSLQNAAYRCGNWVAHRFFQGPDDLHMDVTRAAMPMDAPLVSRTLSALRVLALFALAATVMLAGLRRDALLMGVAFGLACVATLVVSPVSRGHYFVFWAPAVALVPLWLCRCGKPRAALLSAVVPAALTLAHYAALDYAGRAGVLGLGTTLWYFAICAQVCISASRSRAAHAEISKPIRNAPQAA